MIRKYRPYEVREVVGPRNELKGAYRAAHASDGFLVFPLTLLPRRLRWCSPEGQSRDSRREGDASLVSLSRVGARE